MPGETASPTKTSTKGPFRDVPTRSFHYQRVEWLVKQGYANGFPPGTFRGRKPLTRYEFAVATLRFCNDFKVYKGGVTPWQCGQAASEKNHPKPLPLNENPLSDHQGRPIRLRSVLTLRTLARAFTPELAMLGADVRLLQSNMSKLEQRLQSKPSSRDSKPVPQHQSGT
jgi:hypothetical protein